MGEGVVKGQREGGKKQNKGRIVIREAQCSLLMFQLLVVKLSDLDDRRRSAERRPTPTGRGSHRLDLTPAARERGGHSRGNTFSI